jgi:hypothetical protein
MSCPPPPSRILVAAGPRGWLLITFNLGNILVSVAQAYMGKRPWKEMFSVGFMGVVQQFTRGQKL